MTESKNIEILYFTDLLCIWAYLAQIRIDKLHETFGSNISLQNHFVPIFGDVKTKIKLNWEDEGGASAYSTHVKHIASSFEHITVHPDIWARNTPTSSSSSHLFIKAIQFLETHDELPSISSSNQLRKSQSDVIIWEFRLAFFRDLLDISDFGIQMEIAERLDFPLKKIQHVIESGVAFAELDQDIRLKEKYGVTGSPSLVLNEGRQIIYGNVGYRTIEANVQELINHPHNQASWC